MAKQKSYDMLNGSLLDKIVLFALPLAISSILQQLFNAADLAVVGRFASPEAMAAVPVIPCTVCNYCAKVCPQNIGISGTFTAMNTYTLYGNYALAKGRHDWDVKGQGHHTASECIKCGACEGVCPQHIKIRDELERVCKELNV